MSTTLAWGMNRLRHIIREPWSSLTSYSTGTVAVTNNSAGVTGTGTAWLTNIRAGDTFHISGGRYYHILSVNSDTSLTLTNAYVGSTATGQSYTIAAGRTTNATLVDELNGAQRELTAEIEEEDLNYFAVTGTISYAADTELYDLPSVNGTVKKVLYVKRTDLENEKELYPVNLQDRDKYLLQTTNVTADNLDEFYYLLGMQIGILPIPASAVTNNITIHYVPEATDLTLDTSTILLPDDFRELWVYKAALGLTDDPAVAQKYQILHNVMLQTLGPRQLQEGRRVIYNVDD